MLLEIIKSKLNLVNVNRFTLRIETNKDLPFFILVTLDMYRMLQAVEREPVESTTSAEDRATNDILVRIASSNESLLFVIDECRISPMKKLPLVPILTNIFSTNLHSAKSTHLLLLHLKNYPSMVLCYCISLQMVTNRRRRPKVNPYRMVLVD